MKVLAPIYKLLFICICAVTGLLVSAFPPGETAEAQPVRIHAERDSLRTGQVLHLNIVFDHPGNFDRIIMPDSADFSEPFEFRKRTRGITRAGSDSVRIELQFFGTEDSIIDGLEARAVSAGDTTVFPIPEYPVYFVSLIAEESELRPLKPIFQFAAPLLPWIIGILLIIALAWLGYYFWKKYRDRPIETPQPEVPPPPPFLNPVHELERGIEELEQEFRAGKIDVDAFYVKSGDLVRAYYENTHSFPALEQTTREVTAELRRIGRPELLVRQVQTLLNEADLVKFARSEPGREEMAKNILRLKKFAEQASSVDDLLIMNMKMEYNKKVSETLRQQSQKSELAQL